MLSNVEYYNQTLFFYLIMCRLLLQRTSNVSDVPWHKSDAFQPDVLLQSNDHVEQKSPSTNTALLSIVPDAPSGVEQKVEGVYKNGLQKSNSLQVTSTKAQIGAAHKIDMPRIEYLDPNHPKETKVSRITNDNEEVESEDVNSRERTMEMQKRFARACDSMAPSMMEKFKAATTSGRSLELQEIEEIFVEKASGTPQAPETPQQVGESQGMLSEVMSLII